MRTTRYTNYFEDEVLGANPLKLVQLLYRGALDAIASARNYLRHGNIRARSRSISKAMTIVLELSLSLNREQGGELSRNLAALYGYVLKLLMRANFEQREPALDEAERLLSTLLEAWSASAPDESRTGVEKLAQPETAEEYRPVACCF